MNERIKELAEQAIVERLTIDDFVAALKKEPYDFYGFRVAELEKFAELIVRECVQVGGPEDSYTDEWFKAKADSVAKIKEHFGVGSI